MGQGAHSSDLPNPALLAAKLGEGKEKGERRCKEKKENGAGDRRKDTWERPGDGGREICTNRGNGIRREGGKANKERARGGAEVKMGRKEEIGEGRRGGEGMRPRGDKTGKKAGSGGHHSTEGAKAGERERAKRWGKRWRRLKRGKTVGREGRKKDPRIPTVTPQLSVTPWPRALAEEPSMRAFAPLPVAVLALAGPVPSSSARPRGRARVRREDGAQPGTEPPSHAPAPGIGPGS